MRLSRPVLIVGGGIGGLAAALALERRGFASRVIEARQEPSAAGAGIQIGPNGVRILARLGVSDELHEVAGMPAALVVRDALTGSTLADMPLGRWIEDRHGAPYWTLHRADFHAALLRRVRSRPEITVETGAVVEAIEAGAVQSRVRLSDGTVREGGAVVAADGLWSGVRTTYFGAPTPRPVGVCAARTVASAATIPGAERRHVGLWLSPDLHVVHYPVRGGAEIALIAVFAGAGRAASATWDGDPRPGDIARHAARSAPALAALLQAGGQWRVWDLHRAASVAMARGAVALLGDAAHPLRPHLAQGAVMALEDAVVLADTLAAAPGDPAAAFARYAAAREPRVARVAAASERNGTIFHLGGLAAHARNAAMRLLGGEGLMRRYDWLYGWRAE